MNWQTNVGQCSYDSWLDYQMVSTMEDGVGCNHLRLFHHNEWFYTTRQWFFFWQQSWTEYSFIIWNKDHKQSFDLKVGLSNDTYLGDGVRHWCPRLPEPGMVPISFFFSNSFESVGRAHYKGRKLELCRNRRRCQNFRQAKTQPTMIFVPSRHATDFYTFACQSCRGPYSNPTLVY